MLTETVQKLTTVKSQLLIEARDLDEWKSEMAKFTDQDEMIKFDGVIVAAAAIEVMLFKNFSEDWEFNAISVKNTAHEKLLLNKYLHIYFYDNDPDVDEVRKVVAVEWKVRARGVAAQHVLVTQTVAADAADDTLEPYYINDVIYEMISEAPAPYNAGYTLLNFN